MNSQTSSILSIGNNPNLAFYSWKLFDSKLCDVTVIKKGSTSAQNGAHFQFYSSTFGNSRFSLSKYAESLQELTQNAPSNQLKFDFIFLSATSLQEITSLCSQLSTVLNLSVANGVVPTIIVESTDFVNLEVTVQKCLQNSSPSQIEVLLIMTDFDVRLVAENVYKVMDSKKESELVYIGKGHYENIKYTSLQVALINKLGNLLENVGLDVYKLSTPLEFLSYQWKFALPQIVLGPLSIIFEQPFPESLYDYLLAKPLISGLILEIISVIRTMNCKLFKGYDNETALIQRCIQLDPKKAIPQDSNYLELPKLFYNFFNQNDLYLDLLLLQPIFLADDFQIKTPYLEFLYAVLTKFCENNTRDLTSSSLFWLRKNDVNLEAFRLQEQLNLKRNVQLAQETERNAQANGNGQQFNGNGQQFNGTAQPQAPATKQAAQPQQPLAQPLSQPQQPQQQPLQQLATPPLNDDFDDLTDIAVYGAQLNGESFSPEQPADGVPPRAIPPQQLPPLVIPSAQPAHAPQVPNNIYAQQAYLKQGKPQPAPFSNGTAQAPAPNFGPASQQQSSNSPTMPGNAGFPYQQQQQQHFYPQQTPLLRRMSSMPSYQTQQYMSGPPKPTSRKNRKSLFPGTMNATGLDFGGHGGMPGANRPMPVQHNSAARLKHQSSFNVNGRANGAANSVYGMPVSQSQQQQSQSQYFQPQPQQQTRQVSLADLSTSTVLQSSTGPAQPQLPAAQQPQPQLSSGSTFSGGQSQEDELQQTRQQLEPAPQILSEHQKSQTILSFSTAPDGNSSLPEAKPLGITTESTGDKKQAQKKKKGFFGRKKKN